MSVFHCKICGRDLSSLPEWTTVQSNVRAFKHKRFGVWRCSHCHSIHAAEDVDLDAYYREYPFFGKTLDFPMRLGYRRLLRRLRKAGLTKQHTVLDYGCGSGLLVQYLKEQGFNAVGYDPFSPEFNQGETLERQYDCLIAQDVLEHDLTPLELMKTFDRLVKPGGLIFIGTPNASGIDVNRPKKYIHPLHQQFHRHIFAIGALLDQGRKLNWTIRKYYPTPYTNIPILSLKFLHYYMKCFDGTLDALFDKKCNSWRLWLSPETLFYLIFGYFLCDSADIVAIFRTATEKEAEEEKIGK